MNLLFDTNIFLEVILGQSNAKEARELLIQSSLHLSYISDFSIHSIGLLLFRMAKHKEFTDLVSDVRNSGITIVNVLPEEMFMVTEAAAKYGLDFDDAYQYALAEKLDVVIVSFDSDFNKTVRGKKTPQEILGGAVL